MKNNAILLASTLVTLEILYFLVHQVVIEAPYHRAYMLTPIFFILSEGIFLFMSSKKWKGNMENMWFFAHKIGKLTAALALIAIVLFSLPDAGLAFYVRLLISYFVFLIIETVIGVKVTQTGATK